MKKIFSSIALLLAMCVQAQNFSDHFDNKTLRLDYVIGGDASKQEVLLDEISSLPTWAGRTHNLAENQLQGDGQIRVYDAQSNELIYTNSFSTLFQEWLTTDLAKEQTRSYENTFLVPFPKNEVKIELVLFDDDAQILSSWTQNIDPTDILIREKGVNQVTDHVYLQKAKDQDKSINVVFVAEGYTQDQMDKFIEAAKVSMESILEYAPFNTYGDRFNFIAVKSPSIETGVSVPRENSWKQTAVESNFDTFYSERYLTTNRIKKLHDVLAGIDYEHIVILANTDVYGGGGIYNGYTLTTTGHSNFKPVVVHEFGHSFAGLADEYSYANDALSEFVSTTNEPWAKNITTLKDFNQKWEHLLEPGTPIPTDIADFDTYPIGVYEGPHENKIYTSAVDCRMKTNTYDKFCSACQDAIEKLILFYTE